MENVNLIDFTRRNYINFITTTYSWWIHHILDLRCEGNLPSAPLIKTLFFRHSQYQMFISGPEILDQTNHTILKIVSKVGSPVGFLYIISYILLWDQFCIYCTPRWDQESEAFRILRRLSSELFRVNYSVWGLSLVFPVSHPHWGLCEVPWLTRLTRPLMQ